MCIRDRGLEKTPRRALLGVLGILQAAVRDAIFVSKALPQKPLQLALRKQTQALAGAVRDVYKRQVASVVPRAVKNGLMCFSNA